MPTETLSATSLADQHAAVVRGLDNRRLNKGVIDDLNKTTTDLIGDTYVSDEEWTDLNIRVLGYHQQFAAEAGRLSYKGLNEAQIANLGRFVGGLEPPRMLLDSFGAESGTKLVEVVIQTPITAETRPRLLNFFEWQAWASRRHDHEFKDRTLPRLLKNAEMYLNNGAATDVIPDSVYEKYKHMRSTGGLQVEESLLPLIDVRTAADVQVHGLTFRMHDKSSLVLLSAERQDDSYHVFLHEVMHALSGARTNPLPKGSFMYSEDVGLGRIFGNGAGGDALEEAVIEHVTDSLQYGNPEVVYPLAAERMHVLGFYEIERFLLHVLCDAGVKPVDPRLFIAATLEEGDGKPGSKLHQLSHELEQAFPGMRIVQRIRALKIPDNEDKTDVILKFAEAIVSERKRSEAENRARRRNHNRVADRLGHLVGAKHG